MALHIIHDHGFDAECVETCRPLDPAEWDQDMDLWAITEPVEHTARMEHNHIFQPDDAMVAEGFWGFPGCEACADIDPLRMTIWYAKGGPEKRVAFQYTVG